MKDAKQTTHPHPPSGGPGSSSKGTNGFSFSSSNLLDSTDFNTWKIYSGVKFGLKLL